MKGCRISAQKYMLLLYTNLKTNCCICYRLFHSITTIETVEIMQAPSQFDRLPDEIAYQVLCYAMIRDAPFHVDDCMRVAKAVQNSVKPQSEGDSSQTAEDDKCFLMSVQAFGSSELRRSFFQEKEERQSKRPNSERLQSRWLLHDSSIAIQQPHLLDWRIAGSVCRRLRELGKEAFFSNKVFAMSIKTMKGLQDQSLTGLSTLDQQLASKLINSIILIEHNLRSPSTFISLPHCITGFQGLHRLDFFFSGRQGEHLTWINKAARNRTLPPDHFIDALKIIGILTEKLMIGILISPDNRWSLYETQLKENVYPTLRAWATMKARKGPDRTNV